MTIYGIIKWVIVSFFYPFPLCFYLLLAGVLVLLFTDRLVLGKILVVVGFAILTAISLPMMPNYVLKNLEQQSLDFINGEKDEIRYIVVLAGGHYYDENLPVTSQFNYHGLTRLIEGVRQHKINPEARLILSGGPGNAIISEASIMAQLALDLGIQKDKIILESKSMSTMDEAKFIKPMIGSDPFYLITSASHMPRSLYFFRKLGMNPIPVPTGFLAKKTTFSFVPASRNIDILNLVLHEYLGLAKEQIREYSVKYQMAVH